MLLVSLRDSGRGGATVKGPSGYFPGESPWPEGLWLELCPASAGGLVKGAGASWSPIWAEIGDGQWLCSRQPSLSLKGGGLRGARTLWLPLSGLDNGLPIELA